MNYEQAEQRAIFLANGLDEIARLIAGESQLSDQANNLRIRADSLRADRFKVVVVGDFSRGKSTLLNAVLGCDILPQKVIPSTAIITLIEYADYPCARVLYADAHKPEEILSLDEFRNRFVLSEADLTDGKVDTDRFSRVDHAVVSYPVELCRHRVELVDSPGLQDDVVRTARTKKFLKRADAVVMVLDATNLLTQEEVHFLETVLLPEGFKNIFFVINKWNLIEQSVIRPEDAEREFANLESRINDRLMPFCVLNGQDRSTERIFRINALGALKARLRNPQSVAALEESQVPAFEKSLQHFLIEERGKARTDVIIGVIKGTWDEVNRFIATQQAMADKSIAEIEAEYTALQPKLDRLRGIRQHIMGFLDSQSANLQDRLVMSFLSHIKKLETNLPDEIDKFDFSEITSKSMVWAQVTDWMKDDEDKFAKKVENCIKPQLQKLIERHFSAWHHSVVSNEMQSVMIDVDKHLQEEAAEYQRVMREIEDQIGIHSNPLQVKELVERWLGAEEGGANHSNFEISGVAILGDLAFLIGGIALDVAGEIFLHITATLWIPLVGLVITAARLFMREVNMRKQIKEKIVERIHGALMTAGQSKSTDIRGQVRKSFDGLKGKIAVNIDEEIALIEASLQTIIDRKKDEEFSADQEKARLESARTSILTNIEQIQAALATDYA